MLYPILCSLRIRRMPYGIREKSYKADLSMWYVKNRWASEKSSQLFLGFVRAFLLKFISWSRSNTMLKLMLYQFLKAWTTNSGITVWWRSKSAKNQQKCGSLFKGVEISQEMMSEWVESFIFRSTFKKRIENFWENFLKIWTT